MNIHAGTSTTGSRGLVARNTLILMLAQVLGMPLSMLVNVLMGRRLGPGEYGQYYVLTTYATLAFLFVDWGLATVLPARIAHDRPSAGRYLGSALLWTLSTSVLCTGILVLVFWLRGEQIGLLRSLVLVCMIQALAVLIRNGGDTVRGFERTDVAALAQFGTQLLMAVLVIPALLLGGRLDACLVATSAASALVLLGVWRSLRGVGIQHLSMDVATTRSLLHQGVSFLILNLILYIQPTIDAYFLTRYASEEAIGWHAAARKLINPLIFPASALIGALYPTLCRLWTQQRDEYLHTSQGALRASILITVPLAVGCAAFAHLGILLFSTDTYGPAETNLRILASYVFLLYVSMVLGTCLNAAGRQRAWTAVQFLCIIVSVIADPLLVPWFQQHSGNGGLGVSLTTAGSEALMLVAGVALLPRGIVDAALLRYALRVLTAGVAMGAVAWLLSGAPLYASIPAAAATYVAVLFAVRGLDRDQLQLLRSMLKKRGAATAA